MDEFGFKTAQPSDGNALWWRLSQSPTGRQMAMDGTLVYSIYPTIGDLPMTAPDGAHATVSNGATIADYVFTRALGWVAV